MKILWFILFGAVLPRINAGQSRASCSEVRRSFFSKRVGPMKLVPFHAITSE